MGAAVDGAGDSSGFLLLWGTMGSLAAAFGAGFLVLLGRDSKTRDALTLLMADNQTALTESIEKVAVADHNERSRIWDRLDQHAEGSAEHRIDAERRFATKGDLRELGDDLKDTIRSTTLAHEDRIRGYVDAPRLLPPPAVR